MLVAIYSLLPSIFCRCLDLRFFGCPLLSQIQAAIFNQAAPSVLENSPMSGVTSFLTESTVCQIVLEETAKGHHLPSIRDRDLHRIVRSPNFYRKCKTFTSDDMAADTLETICDALMSFQLLKLCRRMRPHSTSNILTVIASISSLGLLLNQFRRFDTASPITQPLRISLLHTICRRKRQRLSLEARSG